MPTRPLLVVCLLSLSAKLISASICEVSYPLRRPTLFFVPSLASFPATSSFHIPPSYHPLPPFNSCLSACILSLSPLMFISAHIPSFHLTRLATTLLRLILTRLASLLKHFTLLSHLAFFFQRYIFFGSSHFSQQFMLQVHFALSLTLHTTGSHYTPNTSHFWLTLFTTSSLQTSSSPHLTLNTVLIFPRLPLYT